MWEAVDVADLTDGDHRGDGLIAFEPHQREHDGLHVPILQQRLHVDLDALDALCGSVDGLQVLLQHHLHRRMRQCQLPQVAHVGRAPGGCLRVTIAVAQKEGFELVTPAAQVMHRIGAGAAKIADRLVTLIRHMHGGEFAGTVKPCEHACIAPVGLDFVTRTLRRERWCDDIAGDSLLLEMARQHEAARTRLVADTQFFSRMAQLVQQLVDTVQAAGDHSMVPDLSVAPGLGDGDGNALGMDIEAQIQYFFAHLCGVLVWLHLVRPAGASCPSPNMRIGLAKGSPRLLSGQHTTPASIKRAALPACSRKPDRSHKV
jgi:hypothetical protein